MAIDAEKQDKAMAKDIFLHVNVFLEYYHELFIIK